MKQIIHKTADVDQASGVEYRGYSYQKAHDQFQEHVKSLLEELFALFNEFPDFMR